MFGKNKGIFAMTPADWAEHNRKMAEGMAELREQIAAERAAGKSVSKDRGRFNNSNFGYGF